MSPRPRRLVDSERLARPVRAYVTEGELAVIDELSPRYGGTAKLLRLALAFLVETKHPELTHRLSLK